MVLARPFGRQQTPPRPEHRFYAPQGGARALTACRADEALLEGPSNTGKSRACLEKLYCAAERYPGMRGLIIRKTRESMSESVLVTWESKVVPPGSPILIGPDRNHRQRYTFPNGSEIVVGGIDKPGKIMSTEYDVIYVPEATELHIEDWESLTTRTRNHVMPYNQLIADCNPAAPSHWLNQRCNTGQTVRLLSRHEDNPTVTEADLRKLRALTGARRARLYEGRWAAQEGLVYEFDSAVHECDRADLLRWGIITDAEPLTLNPANLSAVWGGLDWGWTNPGVLWVAALDKDGRAFLVHEVYESQHTIDWWLTRGRTVQARFAVQEWVADPSEPAYITAWARAVSRRIVAAENDIAPGISLVQERLKVAGDGRPRLYLYADALAARDPVLQEKKRPIATREEFDSYHWPKDAAGREIKEVPVKEDDHGMDTVRYLTAAWDWPRASRKLRTW